VSGDSFSEDFLRRLEAGDSTAFEKVYSEYLPRLIGLAAKRMPNLLNPTHDAEDITQSVFRTFLRHIHNGDFTFQNNRLLWGLLAKITLRKILRRVNQNRLHGELLDPESIVDGQPSAQDAGDLADLVTEFLAKFEGKDVKILQMRLQDDSLGTIAAEVGYSLSTVNNTVREGKAVLRRML
jgi:RNA polymerase sigma factor (sigma-70 family)